MITLGSWVATQQCCSSNKLSGPRTCAPRPVLLKAVRRSVAVRATSQQEASVTVEGLQAELAKVQKDLQREHQQRDYWRMRCMEAEEQLRKLKVKYDNMLAHDHPDAKAAPTARKEELHLGQKRDFTSDDDKRGTRDM